MRLAILLFLVTACFYGERIVSATNNTPIEAKRPQPRENGKPERTADGGS
ncbi:hypothetical protein [Dendronalium sp. ChiSLP03b]